MEPDEATLNAVAKRQQVEQVVSNQKMERGLAVPTNPQQVIAALRRCVCSISAPSRPR